MESNHLKGEILRYNELVERLGIIENVSITVEEEIAVIKYTANGHHKSIESNDTSLAFIIQSVLYVSQLGSLSYLPNF